MSEKFQIGMVVCLKSGGPPMTVKGSTQEIYRELLIGDGDEDPDPHRVFAS